MRMCCKAQLHDASPAPGQRAAVCELVITALPRTAARASLSSASICGAPPPCDVKQSLTMMLHLRRALVLHSRWSKPAFLSFRNPLVMESPCFPNTASGPKADLEMSRGEGLPLRSRTKYQECRNPLASTAVRDRL